MAIFNIPLENIPFRHKPKLDSTVWFLGCDKVYGRGVDDDQTAPCILQKLTNISVDNLGVISASNQFILDLIDTLMQTHVPKAIIVGLPHMQNRYAVVDSKPIFMGRFLSDDVWDELDDVYLINNNLVTQYKLDLAAGIIDAETYAARRTIANMRFSVPVFFFTYYNQLMTPNGWPDFALDGSQGPGPQCQEKIAKLLAPWVLAHCK